MKVIIPIVDLELQKLVIAESFTASEFVCIYNLSSQSYDWYKANEIIKSEGNVTLALKSNNIFSVITNHLQMLAFNLFLESGLKIYKTTGTDLIKNIELFEKGQLPTFTLQHCISFAGCSNSCNSCNSNCVN
jgi:predicted Fe-Mo cluster-binding NifX family protein